ncbi:unnamed protein product [Bathycoccus prasinos]
MSSAHTENLPADLNEHNEDLADGCDNADTYLKFHALLHRGQALNAYEAKMHLDNGTLNFGHGLDFESGKTKKAEKRPPTQIEIMAEMEREKQAKKEERRLAREAKKQARLEQEEFIRNGGNLKLSKKEKRRLEAEMEN